MTTFLDIKNEATRIAREAGVGDIIPTPLETIATSLGFQSLAFDGGDDVAGAIDHSQKRIFVNSNDPATRQRFTLAHELGHAILHSNENIVDYRKNFTNTTDRKEVEANKFAAELLMPENLFRKTWIHRDGNLRAVSAIFGVSSQAAEFRAKSLGLA